MDSASFNYRCNFCTEEIELSLDTEPPEYIRCPECGSFEMILEVLETNRKS